MTNPGGVFNLEPNWIRTFCSNIDPSDVIEMVLEMKDINPNSGLDSHKSLSLRAVPHEWSLAASAIEVSGKNPNPWLWPIASPFSEAKRAASGVQDDQYWNPRRDIWQLPVRYLSIVEKETIPPDVEMMFSVNVFESINQKIHVAAYCIFPPKDALWSMCPLFSPLGK